MPSAPKMSRQRLLLIAYDNFCVHSAVLEPYHGSVKLFCRYLQGLRRPYCDHTWSLSAVLLSFGFHYCISALISEFALPPSWMSKSASKPISTTCSCDITTMILLRNTKTILEIYDSAFETFFCTGNKVPKPYDVTQQVCCSTLTSGYTTNELCIQCRKLSFDNSQALQNGTIIQGACKVSYNVTCNGTLFISHNSHNTVPCDLVQRLHKY